ncbi:helix-turn-helix domain-containing protein [Flavobacterium cerinum]|uniref:Helix-turn-helix domain-containing protein n=1 Tax=Flavobacterium cerinum TaxID=2502784 RepID=A0ABY5IU32_9FLAO|nr:helix-turn-helix domain-containing protein [Flavobacterium cerinum]UUC46314.1 helix-turn-helix domain-containing protein [Flavobacterium cerinum]
METVSNAAAYVLRFINQTQKSIFLTGKAGTGKTTLLREIISTTHKNTVVVAPTGIAALNAGGVTIHSMFQLPFAAFLPDEKADPYISENSRFENRNTLSRHFKMNGTKRAVIQNMELLVIDEVSMLRADIMDAMDFMLRKVRRNETPFGGVQVLFIGDLLQLPPIIKNEEWAVLQRYYRGKFFFHSHVIQQNPPLYIELDKIFRQTDSDFISVLNNLRNNTVTNNDLAVLNQYVQPDFDFKKNPGFITLTTHNAKADTINTEALEELEGKEFVFMPEIVGDFPDKIFPVDEQLKLKVGAQVMFVKNDLSFEKQYFNGKMGVIKNISAKEIFVHFPEENKTIEVERYEWKNIRYYVDEMTKEIEEEILGTFTHYPIKLAWAITIHKSQGLTFDNAALDVSQVFLPGQAYVALSRLRSLKGLILLSPIHMNGISNDADVMDYAQSKVSMDKLEGTLANETRIFLYNYLKDSFNWDELAREWSKHQQTYLSETGKSVKSQSRVWAQQQSLAIHELLDPSRKFIGQLAKLFQQEEVDLVFIEERINKAFDYFFPKMDELVFELYWKIEEIKRLKKVKSFFEELSELEEIQTNVILRLLKVKLLIRAVLENKEISKEVLVSPLLQKYKQDKIEIIKEALRKNGVTLIEDDDDIERYTSKKKKTKEPKKSTIEETLELWMQNLSIPEIARIRKLTVGTVYTHFSKLIQMEAIEISDILPPEKINRLKAAFKEYDGSGLGEIKEKYDDEFSWDELRLYKAVLQKNT